MNHENDKLKFGAPGDAIVMACTSNVNPNDDSVRYYGGILVCESASAEWRRRIVACVNACAGSSTEWLEFIVSDDAIDQFGGPRPFETRHGEVLREALRIMAERDKAEKQRDELLAALKLYEQAFDGLFSHCLSNGVFNAWDAPLDCTELNIAHESARAAIASVKGGAA